MIDQPHDFPAHYEPYEEMSDMTTAAPSRLPDRAELNISPATAELLGKIDDQDDGDVIAQALEAALLALVDIGGSDPRRPAVQRPAKVAKRAIDRVLSLLED